MKILAESLQEFRDKKEPVKEGLVNEGILDFINKTLGRDAAVGIKKFLQNPEDSQAFISIFKEQMQALPVLKELAGKLSKEQKIQIVKKAASYLKKNPSMDKLQIPFKPTEKGLQIDIGGQISGKGVTGRSGIHGGTSTKA